MLHIHTLLVYEKENGYENKCKYKDKTRQGIINYGYDVG